MLFFCRSFTTHGYDIVVNSLIGLTLRCRRTATVWTQMQQITRIVA